MRLLLNTLALLLFALTASNALAEGGEFYKRGAEGWFWYHDPEPEPEPEPKKEEKLPPLPAPAKPTETAETKTEAPPAFSVKWYQENMEQVLDRAIDNPTDENVAAYFFIHRLMLDKANKFAVTAREVAMENPQLDSLARVTPGGAARRLQEKQQLQILESISQRLNEADGAIWFWYNDDVYSQRMARILRGLRNKTGIQVVAFSVTGGPLTGEAEGWFPDYVVDSGAAARKVGVSHTPALAIALPPDKSLLLAHGVVGRSHIEDRMVIAANKLGLIEEKDLNVYQGRNPGAGLLDATQLVEMEGNSTEEILEVMGETFGY